MIFLPVGFIRCEISHIDRGPTQTPMAREEFTDQIAFNTPLKRGEQKVDSGSACDQEEHLGERHGLGSV
jgi:hypothetical protein